MKMYLASLAAGLLVGVVYGLLQIRSPAPPIVALLGLFGILVGEQIVPLARRLGTGHPASLSQLFEDCRHHVLGRLPDRSNAPPPETEARNG